MSAAQRHALQEAESWFARMRGGGHSPSEARDFERWLGQPGCAAAYAEIEALWTEIGGLAGQPGLADLVHQAKAAGQAGRWRGRLWSATAVAGICCLVVALALAWLWYLRSGTETYASPALETLAVRLPDGSSVTLNRATVLEANLRGRERRFVLRQGEALFEVKRDPRRPFVVTAGEGRVTALGTRFQVSRQGHGVTLVLLDGRVVLDRQDTAEHRSLDPGDRLQFRDSVGGIAASRVDPRTVASWIHGRLVFHAMPLAQALVEVNRYASVPIHIADPDLGAIPVSGTFRVGDSHAVAVALPMMLPVTVSSNAAGMVVARRR